MWIEHIVMASAVNKPLVGIRFTIDDHSKGFARALVEQLKTYFRIVTLSDIETKPELMNDIKALVIDPAVYQPFLPLVKKMPQLRIVGTASAGYNHMYDFPQDWVKENDIKMVYTPRVLDASVAELTLGLILATSRNIVTGASIAMSSEMPVFYNDVFGQNVSGKTLGIVGMGGIGLGVAQKATFGFEMKVMYHNRNQRSREIEESVQATYCATLDEMLPQCDFVVITCALTPETTGLFGEKEFKLMKSSATIVNVSRGPVINQEALTFALQNNEIRSAALDVTYPEPLPRDHPLLQCPNCLIIPHYGSATLETRSKMMQTVINDILAVLEGRPQTNQLVLT